MEFSHFNKQGKAKMVDVGQKSETQRIAIARGCIEMSISTVRKIAEAGIAKGDVLSVAQIAGIMGAKRTSDLIPMCHPLMLTGVDLQFSLGKDRILIEAEVKTTGKTGVEMEALNAVSIAALTIYDMCKAVDKGMVIGGIRLFKKTGGKSGDYNAPDSLRENETQNV